MTILAIDWLSIINIYIYRLIDIDWYGLISTSSIGYPGTNRTDKSTVSIFKYLTFY